MKKILCFLLFLLVLTGCGSQKSETAETHSVSRTAETTEQNPKSGTPTIFFHGYAGTAQSFGGMITRFEKAGLAKKELVVTVAADGTVSAEGKLTGEKNNPMVQVLFEDNRNNEWNQAEWVSQVLHFMKEQYGVDQVNIVGHSMGGVSTFRYLESPHEESVPTIEHYVAIGSPFNDLMDTGDQTAENVLANGPNVLSNRYQDFQASIDNFPADIPCLLIAGQLSEAQLDDGTVPMTSVLSAYPLLEKNGNPVTYHILVGQDAQHSQLHENPKVDHFVSDFLWEK